MAMTFISNIKEAWQQQNTQPAIEHRSVDEYEFQPGYLEIIERPPSPWARRTALALTLLVIITLVWAVVGKLDIHANAAGRLIVSSHTKVIQSIETGEIASINVRDGQRVKKGDVLIELNPIGVEAEVDDIQQSLLFKLLDHARLSALLTDDPLNNFSVLFTSPTEQVTLARQHLLSQWQEITVSLHKLDSDMSVNLANQQAGQIEIISLEKLLGNITARLDARRALEAIKLLAKMELLEQEKERLETERALAQQYAELDVLKAQYASLVDQKGSYLASIHRDTYDKLNQVNKEIESLKQSLIKVQEKRRLQSLRAPVEGVVQQLAVHTVGGVVQPAQQLLAIVPVHAALEIEVKVLNKDVGFVLAGQSVEIKIDSFPYTRYGTIHGEVAHISRDAVQDEKLGLVFPARITLDKEDIVVEDHVVPLQAGMSVSTEIRTGDRRIIDYLLSPLQQYQSEALRER